MSSNTCSVIIVLDKSLISLVMIELSEVTVKHLMLEVVVNKNTMQYHIRIYGT